MHTRTISWPNSIPGCASALIKDWHMGIIRLRSIRARRTFDQEQGQGERGPHEKDAVEVVGQCTHKTMMCTHTQQICTHTYTHRHIQMHTHRHTHTHTHICSHKPLPPHINLGLSPNELFPGMEWEEHFSLPTETVVFV